MRKRTKILPVPNVSLPPGQCSDLDGDNDVDLSDLAALLASYGTCEDDPAFNPSPISTAEVDAARKHPKFNVPEATGADSSRWIGQTSENHTEKGLLV